jgi:hypothetical protein
VSILQHAGSRAGTVDAARQRGAANCPDAVLPPQFGAFGSLLQCTMIGYGTMMGGGCVPTSGSRAPRSASIGVAQDLDN